MDLYFLNFSLRCSKNAMLLRFEIIAYKTFITYSVFIAKPFKQEFSQHRLHF